MASRLLAGFLGACLAASAHDVITTKVTWTREISRLVYKRCGGCHREGGQAFSLVNYGEARPWAKAIKEETLERRMPPWGAVKGFGSFRDDRGLTQEELELISDWVEGGAPEGDPKLLPPVPKWDIPAPRVGSPAHETVVPGVLTLKTPVMIAGLRGSGLQEGATVQVVATLPSGEVTPLLWLYQYRRQFDRTYYFESPMALPAGTRIECLPSNAGGVALVTATRRPAR